MIGFTYNGVHCSTYGVGWAPDASARWWDGPEFSTYKKDVSWHRGGYWYGNSVNIREITLACYFEEIDIATRENIRRWLGRDTSGKLVFDDKTFMYYNVRPSKVVPGQIYNDTNGSYSGTFTVTFLATDPFGYLTRKYNTGGENDGAENYCGIISSGSMPQLPTTASRSFSVYNAGTEPCGLTIRLSGTCSRPIRFINDHNGTCCVISSLPVNNAILDIDGDTGMVTTYASGSSSRENGFAYHDYGIIKLDPCQRFGNVQYTAVENGTGYTITPEDFIVTEDILGGSAVLSPTTRSGRITSVDENANAFVCASVTGTGTLNLTGKMSIRVFNYIHIQEKNNSGNWITPTTLSLNSIEIDYKPSLL